jgi:hypothetical protein
MPERICKLCLVSIPSDKLKQFPFTRVCDLHSLKLDDLLIMNVPVFPHGIKEGELSKYSTKALIELNSRGIYKS